MKDSNACVTQWYLALQFFWVWVGHRPKKEREKVDFFSRTDEEIWLLGECTNWSTHGREVCEAAYSPFSSQPGGHKQNRRCANKETPCSVLVTSSSGRSSWIGERTRGADQPVRGGDLPAVEVYPAQAQETLSGL